MRCPAGCGSLLVNGDGGYTRIRWYEDVRSGLTLPCDSCGALVTAGEMHSGAHARVCSAATAAPMTPPAASAASSPPPIVQSNSGSPLPGLVVGASLFAEAKDGADSLPPPPTVAPAEAKDGADPLPPPPALPPAEAKGEAAVLQQDKPAGGLSFVAKGPPFHLGDCFIDGQEKVLVVIDQDLISDRNTVTFIDMTETMRVYNGRLGNELLPRPIEMLIDDVGNDDEYRQVDPTTVCLAVSLDPHAFTLAVQNYVSDLPRDPTAANSAAGDGAEPADEPSNRAHISMTTTHIMNLIRIGPTHFGDQSPLSTITRAAQQRHHRLVVDSSRHNLTGGERAAAGALASSTNREIPLQVQWRYSDTHVFSIFVLLLCRWWAAGQ